MRLSWLALSGALALGACASTPDLMPGEVVTIEGAVMLDAAPDDEKDGSMDGSSQALAGLFFINGGIVALTVESAQLGFDLYGVGRNCSPQYAAAALVRDAARESFTTAVAESAPAPLPPVTDDLLEAYFEKGATGAMRVAVEDVVVDLTRTEDGDLVANARTSLAQRVDAASGGGRMPAQRQHADGHRRRRLGAGDSRFGRYLRRRAQSHRRGVGPVCDGRLRSGRLQRRLIRARRQGRFGAQNCFGEPRRFAESLQRLVRCARLATAPPSIGFAGAGSGRSLGAADRAHRRRQNAGRLSPQPG